MKAEGQPADLLGGLLEIGRDYLRSEVRVSVESNLLPRVLVYSGGTAGGGSAAGIASALGIKAGVVVRNANGDVLAKFGNPSPPDPLRVLLLVGALFGVGYVLRRVLR